MLETYDRELTKFPKIIWIGSAKLPQKPQILVFLAGVTLDNPVNILQAWTNCGPDIDRARTFCLVKNKKTYLQVLCRIGKTMKKLQWIPNTIMNTNLLVIFW